MKDRVPTKPNRMLVSPEGGNPAFYATITRADEPTQTGDTLSKATFLQDDTAALFGLGQTAVPNDALRVTGMKLNEFDDTWKMKKIADVTLTEDVQSFYIELPRVLSEYACIMVRSNNLRGGTADVQVYAVDSLTSTSTTSNLFELRRLDASSSDDTASLVLMYPVVLDLSGLLCYTQSCLSGGNAFAAYKNDCTDTKYLYLKANDSIPTVLAGGHVEMWGFAK